MHLLDISLGHLATLLRGMKAFVLVYLHFFSEPAFNATCLFTNYISQATFLYTVTLLETVFPMLPYELHFPGCLSGSGRKLSCSQWRSWFCSHGQNQVSALLPWEVFESRLSFSPGTIPRTDHTCPCALRHMLVARSENFLVLHSPTLPDQ